MRLLTTALTGLLLSSTVFAATPPPWLGAAGLLDPASATVSPEKQLQDDVEKFTSSSTSMSPDAAAVAFDALLVRGQQLHGIHNVFGALPAPSSWPALRKLWRARATAAGANDRDRALAVVGDVLVDGVKKSQPAIDTLHLEQRFQPQEAWPASPRERVARLLSGERSPFGDGVDVGDLVGDVGEAEARKLLLSLLRLPNRPFRAEGATLAVAREVVATNIEVIATPPWQLLTTSSPPPALFDLVEKRFVPPGAAIGSSATLPHVVDRGAFENGDDARSAYLLALLRTDRAAAARSLSFWLERAPEACGTVLVKNAQANGVLPALVDLLTATVKEPPVSASGLECLARLVVDGSLRLGRGNALLAVMPPGDGSTAAGRAWQRSRIDVSLALDDVKTATKLLASIVNASSETGERRAEAAEQLLQIGVATADEALIATGVTAVLDRCSGVDVWRCDDGLDLAREVLLARQQGPRFEAWLKAQLAAETKGMRDYERAGLLLHAVGLYAAAGRSADALRVLEQSTWPAPDVLQIDHKSTVTVAVARALHDVGRSADASRLLRASMQGRFSDNGHGTGIANDEAWELLARIEGQSLVPFLDEQRRIHPLEERPLLWKAWLLAKAGDLSGAEASARAAIALDPADGDQRRGHRFRGYVVLAEILRANHRDGEAAVIEDAVAAVRLGEDADRMREAGLLSRAASTYARALARFSDAYCLQSRLGVVEESLGRSTARDHLKQAYRLLPSSFGPVETHCLRCDGLFASRDALQLGEGVLRERLQAAPDDAHAHYFLGRVLSELDQGAASQRELLRAWQLDSGYVSALRELTGDGGARDIGGGLPAGAQRDAVEIARLKVDPRCGASSACRTGADDLAALYLAASTQTQAPRVPPVGFALRSAMPAEMFNERMPPLPAPGAAALLSHAVLSSLLAVVDGR